MKKMFLFLNKKILMFVMLLLSGYVWVNAEAYPIRSSDFPEFRISSVSSPYNYLLGKNYSPGEAFNLTFFTSLSGCNNETYTVDFYVINQTDDTYSYYTNKWISDYDIIDVKWWRNVKNATKVTRNIYGEYTKPYKASTIPGKHAIYIYAYRNTVENTYEPREYYSGPMVISSCGFWSPGSSGGYADPSSAGYGEYCSSYYNPLYGTSEQGKQLTYYKPSAYILYEHTYCVTGAGLCVEEEVSDVCPNIDEIQTDIPVGYELDVNGDCVPTITDVCLNIDEIQTDIPVGYELDVNGDCLSPVTYACVGRDWVGTRNSEEKTRVEKAPMCGLNAVCDANIGNSNVEFKITPSKNLATTTYTSTGKATIIQYPGTSHTYTIPNTKSRQTMDVTVTDSFDNTSKNVKCEVDTSETNDPKIPPDTSAKPSIKITKKPLVTLDKGGDCTLSWKIENMPEGTKCTLSGNGITSSSSDVTKTPNSTYIADDIQSNTEFKITCAGPSLNPSLTETALCRVNPEFNEI